MVGYCPASSAGSFTKNGMSVLPSRADVVSPPLERIHGPIAGWRSHLRIRLVELALNGDSGCSTDRTPLGLYELILFDGRWTRRQNPSHGPSQATDLPQLRG